MATKKAPAKKAPAKKAPAKKAPAKKVPAKNLLVSLAGKKAPTKVGKLSPETCFRLMRIVEHYTETTACPSGYAWQISGQQSFCTLNGFAPMSEERSASVDGVIPARIEQQNEWPQMRSAFCTRGRALRAQPFTPTAYWYTDSVAATATCPIAPVY